VKPKFGWKPGTSRGFVK